MPRPFCLRPIGMFLDMTAQRVPIQRAGPARARTLVRQAARLEPAIHTRLPDLEPPSRFGLAASSADKLDNPLAQIS